MLLAFILGPLLEKYLHGEEITEGEIKAVLRRRVVQSVRHEAAPFVVVVESTDAPDASRILQETQYVRSSRPTSNRGLWWVAAVIFGGPIVLSLLMELLDLLRRPLM